jgi:hypothetical protein
LPINGKVSVVTWTVNNGPGGPDANIAQDFRYVNAIYSQIGISFSDTANKVLNMAPPPGGWTVASITGTGGLFDKNHVGPAPGNNPINLYYVPNIANRGFAVPNYLVGANHVRVGAVANSPIANRVNDTVAHELGHILLDTWRWRPAEAIDTGLHSNAYNANISPYLVGNVSGANNLMAAGADALGHQLRNVPANLNQVAPGVGSLDQINLNVGSQTATPNAPQPEISAMYNNTTSVTNVNRAQITVTVGKETSAPRGWGTTFTSTSDVTVNEAARVTSAGRTEELMFEYRNAGSGFFQAGVGLILGFGKIYSLDYPYLGIVANSLKVFSFGNIIDPGTPTLLTEGAQYTDVLKFNAATHTLTSGMINFKNLPNDQKDILVEFAVSVPEPTTWFLVGQAILMLGGFRAFQRRRKCLRA